MTAVDAALVEGVVVVEEVFEAESSSSLISLPSGVFRVALVFGLTVKGLAVDIIVGLVITLTCGRPGLCVLGILYPWDDGLLCGTLGCGCELTILCANGCCGWTGGKFGGVPGDCHVCV